jgi:hypothetical protein
MKKLFLAFIVLLVSQVSYAQLIVYANLNLGGTSATCLVRTTYTGSSIPNGLNNTIESIFLSQGFMATIAENEDGTGERFTYMANSSNISVNLAFVLQNKVSYIRVLKLHPVPIKKKGSGNTNNAYTADLNASWFYDWGPFDFSTPTREFVPMAWGTNHASDANINIVIAKDTLTHYSAFNEPDHEGQSNMFVSKAIPLYKKMLRAGLRMGSPACTESQYRTWLDSFMLVSKQDSLRVDYVCDHWYDWGNWLSTLNPNPNPVDVFNRFKNYVNALYDFHKKPIWITEFNANVNRTAYVNEEFMRLALPWLDANPNVERYAFFFGNDLPMYSSPGVLSTGGSIYANHASVNAYPDNIYDTRPSAPFVLAAWNPSTFTQGGNTVTEFDATTIATNVTNPLGLTRGSGVDLPTASASNGYWGGNNWSLTTAAAGVTANKFMRFSLKSSNGKSVNYHTIDKLNIRISSNGPVQYQIDYQVDNGTFRPIKTIVGIPRTTGNYQLGPIDLYNIDGLQDVPPTSTVTFRITPFDATNNTGSFLIGSGTGDTDPDLSITGGFSDANIITTSLPVTLTDFRLTRSNNKNLLSWETQSELGFSYFEVERSKDGNTFYKLTTINGSNRSNGNTYHYTDVPSNATTHYYRLKMIDNDGSFKYSKILSTINNMADMSFVVYPTVVAAGKSIRASFSNVSTAAQLRVLHVSGQSIATYNLQPGANTQSIETAGFGKGVYIVLLQNNGSVKSKKIAIQ